MVHISNHPIVMDKIKRLRDEKTSPSVFRKNVKDTTMLLFYEIAKNFPTKRVSVKTPLGVANCSVLSKEITVVGILRAGLMMMEGISELVDNVKLAHIGIYRDEDTLKPIRYYVRLPKNISNDIVIITDPMLATGGSAIEAINIVKNYGAKMIYFMSIISSSYGIKQIKKYHPDVKIYSGSLDEKINSNGYIIPGLGDAGDRMFGTF